MKQYALVKDGVTGKTFGIVVRDGITETCYGIGAKGEAWASAYNEMQTKSLEDELPYGVEIGDFRGMAHFEQVLIEEMADGNKDVRLLDRDRVHMVKSEYGYGTSLTPSVFGRPLNSFSPTGDIETVVEYKVRYFLNSSAKSSVMAKVRLERLGIDAASMKFKSRTNNEFLEEDLEYMARGKGNLRRSVVSVFRAKQATRANHDGYDPSPFEPEVKALGPRLGGGLRAAPRGMSFVDITGRVDGDNDGIVFEGVPGMERPIIPRFMVPKNMARRISALVDGDSMEIEKSRRAGNSSARIDDDRLQELLGDNARFVTRLNGEGLRSRRGQRRTQDPDAAQARTRDRRAQEFFEMDRDQRREYLALSQEDRRRSLDAAARERRAQAFFAMNRDERRAFFALSPEERDAEIDRRVAEGRQARRDARRTDTPDAPDDEGMRSQRQSQRTDWTGDGKPVYLRNDPQSELVAKRRDEFGRLEEIYRDTETGKFFGRQTGFSDYDTEGVSIRDGDKRQFDTAEEVQRVAEADSLSQFNASSGMRSRRTVIPRRQPDARLDADIDEEVARRREEFRQFQIARGLKPDGTGESSRTAKRPPISQDPHRIRQRDIENARFLDDPDNNDFALSDHLATSPIYGMRSQRAQGMRIIKNWDGPDPSTDAEILNNRNNRGRRFGLFDDVDYGMAGMKQPSPVDRERDEYFRQMSNSRLSRIEREIRDIEDWLKNDSGRFTTERDSKERRLARLREMLPAAQEEWDAQSERLRERSLRRQLELATTPLTDREKSRKEELEKRLLNPDGSIKTPAQRRRENQEQNDAYWRDRKEREKTDFFLRYSDEYGEDFADFDRRYKKDLRELRKLQRRAGEYPPPKKERKAPEQPQRDSISDSLTPAEDILNTPPNPWMGQDYWNDLRENWDKPGFPKTYGSMTGPPPSPEEQAFVDMVRRAMRDPNLLSAIRTANDRQNVYVREFNNDLLMSVDDYGELLDKPNKSNADLENLLTSARSIRESASNAGNIRRFQHERDFNKLSGELDSADLDMEFVESAQEILKAAIDRIRLQPSRRPSEVYRSAPEGRLSPDDRNMLDIADRIFAGRADDADLFGNKAETASMLRDYATGLRDDAPDDLDDELTSEVAYLLENAAKLLEMDAPERSITELLRGVDEDSLPESAREVLRNAEDIANGRHSVVGGLRGKQTEWDYEPSRSSYFPDDDELEIVARRTNEFGSVEEVFRNPNGKFMARTSGVSDRNETGAPVRNPIGDVESDTMSGAIRMLEGSSALDYDNHEASQGGMRSSKVYVSRASYGLDLDDNMVMADMTMDEAAELEDLFRKIHSRVNDTDESFKDSLGSIIDGLETAQMAVDVMAVDKEEIDRALDGLRRFKRSDNDSSADRLIDFLDGVVEGHSNDQVWQSQKLDESGTRLTQGLRSMRPSRDEVGNGMTPALRDNEAVADLPEDGVLYLYENANMVTDRIADSLGDDVSRSDIQQATDKIRLLSDLASEAWNKDQPLRVNRDDLDAMRTQIDNYMARVDGDTFDNSADEIGRFIDDMRSAHDGGSAVGGMRSQRQSLARGDGQVQRDDRGNIIPQEDRDAVLAEAYERRNNRLRELGFNDDEIDRLTSGLRSRRDFDSLNDEEIGRTIDMLNSEQQDLRRELGLIYDPRSNDPENMKAWRRSQRWKDTPASGLWSAEDMPENAEERLDRLREVSDAMDALMARRGESNRSKREREARQRTRDKITEDARTAGVDPEEGIAVDDMVYSRGWGTDADLPGEDFSRLDEDRTRRGFDTINSEEEERSGVFGKGDGVLDGARWNYTRRNAWTESTRFDPEEDLYLDEQLEIVMPNGNRYLYESDGMGDWVYAQTTSRDRGMRSARRTMPNSLKDSKVQESYGSLIDQAAAAIEDGNVPFMDPSMSRRALSGWSAGLRSSKGDGLTAEQRTDLANYLDDAAHAVLGNGLRSKKKKKKDAPNKLHIWPDSDTDTTETVAAIKRATGKKAVRDVPDAVSDSDLREVFEILGANGFAWQNDYPAKGGKIFLPDRLMKWTRVQNGAMPNVPGGKATVDEAWRARIAGEEGRLRPGDPLNFRITHASGGPKAANAIKSWMNTIFGDGAWDDLVANSKRRGRGKVGEVPSLEGPPSGVRDGERRGAGPDDWRNADWFKRQEAARDEITGDSGLGGGMRSRRRRGTAGKTKASDTDGKAWESLSDSQRRLVEQAAREREGKLFWTMTSGQPLRGARQNMRDDDLWKDGMSEADMQKIPPPDDLIPIMQAKLDDALRDGDIDKTKHAKLQKQLDDLITLAQMRRDNNYEMLEHLHDNSKKKIIGDSRKGDSSIPTAAKLGLDGESSWYTTAAGTQASSQSEMVAERAAKRKGKRRIPLVDRILQPDPDREARRAARRQKRQTGRGGGFTTDEQSRVGRIERARRTAGRLRRRIRARLTGGQTEKKITEQIDKINDSKKVRVDGDKIVLSPDATKAFAQIRKILDDDPDAIKTLSTKDRDGNPTVANNKLMGAIWNALGYNDLPIAVTEEELANLMELGHRVILRGHRTENNAQGYIDDPLRFLVGEGGSLSGFGEYWSDPVDGQNFDSWLQGSGNLVTVGVLAKNAQVIEASDLDSELPNLKEIGKVISLAETQFPGGMDKAPVDDVAQMMRTEFDKLSDVVKESKVGQLANQIIERLEAGDADAIAGATTLRDINELYGQNSRNLLGMVLGYDAVIMTGKNGSPKGPAIVFSRSSMTVADKSIGSDRAREWQRDARNVAQGKAPESTPPPAKRKFGKSSSTPTWDKISKMEKVSGPLGSQGGQWYQDKNGKRYFTKPGKSEAHAANETAVAAIYGTAGVGAPSSVMYGDNDVATVVIEGLDVDTAFSITPERQAEIKKNMGLDMLLSNWDAGQGGNIGLDKNGNMIRLDAGGGGQFRAQGGPKPSFATGRLWGEPASMITSPFGQQIYGTVTNGDMADAMAQVANLDLGMLDAAMKAAGVDDATRKVFRDVIQERQREAVRLQGLYAAADLSAAVVTTGSGPGSTVRPG